MSYLNSYQKGAIYYQKHKLFYTTIFDKLPYRLHQFRFFYSEQSRVTGADMYGFSISLLYRSVKSIPLQSELLFKIKTRQIDLIAEVF